MTITAVATTAGLSLVLIGLLVGCGTDRSPFGPPDATFTLQVADPSDQTPIGEVVDLVFEVLDEESKGLQASTSLSVWKPPYRVASQLVVCAHMNQEFFAEGSWRNQQITVQGVVRPVDENTGVVPVTYSRCITTLSGASKQRTCMRSAIHLKPHIPTEISVGVWSADDPQKPRAMVMWLRPRVTPGQSAPLSPQP